MSCCKMTESALVDLIKNQWRLYKDERNCIAGDYYYQLLLDGVLFNKVIKIKINHFDKHLQNHLGGLSPSYVKQIIDRTIFELIREIKDSGFAYLCHKEGRIRWCFA